MVSGLWSKRGRQVSTSPTPGVGDVDTCLLRVFQKPPFLSSGLSPVNHPETAAIPDALAGGWMGANSPREFARIYPERRYPKYRTTFTVVLVLCLEFKRVRVVITLGW